LNSKKVIKFAPLKEFCAFLKYFYRIVCFFEENCFAFLVLFNPDSSHQYLKMH